MLSSYKIPSNSNKEDKGSQVTSTEINPTADSATETVKPVKNKNKLKGCGKKRD